MNKLGRYEVLEELGRGAMGAVYLGRDPVIDRTVAIKTILASAAGASEAEEFRKRFFREAQAAGRLSHPGLVTIHDVGEEESTHTPYIVMEFIAGKTLECLMSEARGVLPTATTLDLIKQVAEALDYAHAQGIVHRDIKPANVIVTPASRAIVTDFGVARLRLAEVTVAGEVLGTPAFMSPEQFEGKRVDGRSDLFSLGVILYWMLTGQKPFAGKDLSEVMFKVVYQDPPAISELNPQLSADFNLVLSRALAKDPRNRYQRGQEFADDLEDLRQRRAPRSSRLSRDESTAAPLEATQALEETVALKPRDRSSDHAAGVETTVVGQPLAAAPPAAKPGPVVAVDWQRVGGYSKSVGQKALAGGAFLWAHAAAFARTLPQRSTQAAALARRGWTWFRARPRSVQIVLAIVVLVAVSSVVVYSLRDAFTAKTTISFSLRHDLRSGEFRVWIDGRRVGGAEFTGTESRRMGVFRRVEGSYSTTLQVLIGRRTVRVRVTSSVDNFDQTREIDANFSQGQELTLYATCDSRRNSLTLSLR